MEGKTVLLTFGLLSPNKGIEYVIEALPRSSSGIRISSISCSARRIRTCSRAKARPTG